MIFNGTALMHQLNVLGTKKINIVIEVMLRFHPIDYQ
jgi:hypothetical protein